MRNISFTETKPQFRARQKHRTRRGNKNGPTWKNLKPGDVLMGCEQCQGLGKGGTVVRMGPIVILETNFEPLDDIIRRPRRNYPEGPLFDTFSEVCQYRSRTHGITDGIYGCRDPIDPQRFCCSPIACDGIPETTMEGFPYMTPEKFVDMFCAMNDCEPETEINSILFDYVDVKPWMQN